LMRGAADRGEYREVPGASLISSFCYVTGVTQSIRDTARAMAGDRLPATLRKRTGDARRGGGRQMDDRVEAFLRDVLALEGENSIDVRRGVRHRLAGCEKQMKEKAAHSCRALCRARVLEEIPRHKRTETAEHLKLVLDIVDLRIRLAQAIHG
jgi:hypothetical protein